MRERSRGRQSLASTRATSKHRVVYEVLDISFVKYLVSSCNCDLNVLSTTQGHRRRTTVVSSKQTKLLS